MDREKPGFIPLPDPSPKRASIHAQIADKLSLSEQKTDTINPAELKRLLKAHKTAKKLGREPEEEGKPVCRRCRTIMHTPLETIRKFPDPTKTFAELRTARSAVVVCVADVLDLPGSVVTDLKKLAGDRPSVLVVGKIDAMPEEWDRASAKDYAEDLARSLGIDETVLVSAATGAGLVDLSQTIGDLIAAAREKGENPSVWVVGRSNAGKSRLLGALMSLAVRRHEGGPFDALATASPLPGTTVGAIRAPLSSFGSLFGELPPVSGESVPSAAAELIDTPGLPNPSNLLNLLTLPECRQTHPRGPITQRGFAMPAGRTLFVSGLTRIDCIEGEVEASVYVSKGVAAHRTQTERAVELRDKHLGGLLYPPTVEEGESAEARLKLIPEMVKAMTVDVPASRSESVDVVLSGLGWVNFKSRRGAKVEVWTAGGGGVTTREGWDAGEGWLLLPSGRKRIRT